MKTLPFILFIGLFFVSCTKTSVDRLPQEPIPSIDIAGTWQWVGSTGGWGGEYGPSADSVVKISLNSDSSFIVKLNNSIRYSGHFSLQTHPFDSTLHLLQCDRHFSIDRLNFHEQEVITYFQNDTCRFLDYGITDGDSHLFKRIR